MNIAIFDLPNGGFGDDDRARVESFKKLFRTLDKPSPDYDSETWTPLTAIQEHFQDNEQEIEAVAASLERGVIAGIDAIESIWFIIGEFLYILTRADLWKYLDGAPESMYAWAMMRDEEHVLSSDNPLKKSYPLLSKYRLVYRRWFFEVGQYDEQILQAIRGVSNVDVLEAYTRVISPEDTKYAKAWAEDAQGENKHRAWRKTKIAAQIAKKRKQEIWKVSPHDVNTALEKEEKRHPDARLAQRVPARYRGNIPSDAYVEEEVEAISECETRITIRRID